MKWNYTKTVENNKSTVHTSLKILLECKYTYLHLHSKAAKLLAYARHILELRKNRHESLFGRTKEMEEDEKRRKKFNIFLCNFFVQIHRCLFCNSDFFVTFSFLHVSFCFAIAITVHRRSHIQTNIGFAVGRFFSITISTA